MPRGGGTVQKDVHFRYKNPELQKSNAQLASATQSGDWVRRKIKTTISKYIFQSLISAI